MTLDQCTRWTPVGEPAMLSTVQFQPTLDLGWMSLGDDEREREYSPSSCVGGDIEPYLIEYAEASEAARHWCSSKGIAVQTATYGPSPAHSIDLATPGGDQAPLVVFFHGGYWQELSKRESFSPARGFLANGVGYAAVDYTLAPTANIDQIVAECTSAFHALHDAAAALNIDPARMIVAGSSAGAHLAAMVALDARTAPMVAGMILLSGIYELEPLIGTSINDALGLDVVAARRNSPVRLLTDDSRTAVIAYGDNETDQFKKQSHMFAHELAARGSEPTELEVAGRNHFDVLTDLGQPSSELGKAAHQLITSTGDDDASV